jgi:nitrite reductase (NADH) small subunit
MARFVKVAKVEEIPPGQGKQVIVHEKPMALFNVDGAFYAVNQICPHMGGPLSEGIHI